MPGTTIGIKMKAGYAGTVSRTADSIIQSRVAKAPFKFGQAIILNGTNEWDVVTSSTVATAIAGVAVREVVQANTFNPQSNPDYTAGSQADVLVRGNVTVHCQRGTPASGSAVYVRVAANETYPDAEVGGFEASADSTNTILVDNIEWTTGIMDENNITEITVKTRQKG